MGTKSTEVTEKIQPQTARVIVKEGNKLANFPECKNVKKLVNFKYEYRLRVGDYRVFFNVNETVEIVFIEEVKKRDNRTYKH